MSTVRHPKVEKYLEEVCELVKNKRVHGSIKDELVNHIEEIVEDYVNVGLAEEEAIDKALLRMGSSQVVGRDLNKVHKAAPDFMLLGITGLFILVGIFTLGFMKINNAITETYYSGFLGKTIIVALVGIISSVVLLKIDYRKLKKYSKHIYGGAMLLLIMEPFLSAGPVNGITGWIVFGPIIFNVFIITPFLFILAVSGIYENWNWNTVKNTLIGIFIGVIPAIFFLLGHDEVNLVIYLVAVFTLMIISGMRLRSFITYLGVMGVMGSCYFFSESYRITRLYALFNPLMSDNGSMWLYNQIVTLRESAGLFGKGANFIPNMLPEAHTDFIFTYIVYSFGWIAGIILISLILAFIIRIGYIGRSTKESYGKLLISGFCTLFTVRFILSISVSLTLSPTVSVSMPFISYGGSQLLINIIAISIISNVYKWRNTPYIQVIQ